MKKTIKTLSEFETNMFLASIAKHPPTPRGQARSVRDSCIVLLMLDAGLRVGETVMLLRSDLWATTHSHTTLVVRAEVAKTRTERTIPVTDRLRLAIENMQRYVWCSENLDSKARAFYTNSAWQRISIRQVQKLIKHACIVAGIREISPHTLRHTFATRVMKQSNTRVVQQLLGHSSLSSTQIYTHPDQEDRKKAIDQMEKNTDAGNHRQNENAPEDLEAST